jgi:hypothetical protein
LEGEAGNEATMSSGPSHTGAGHQEPTRDPKGHGSMGVFKQRVAYQSYILRRENGWEGTEP